MHNASVSNADRKEALRVNFVTHQANALQALRAKCQKNTGFRRLLELAGFALVSRGKSKPQLSGNTPEATKALRKAVEAFSQPHRADVPQGAAASWTYLMLKKKKLGKKRFRTLTKVSKLEAVCTLHQEATLDSFKVRKLLGYSPSISWQAAAKLNRVHGPPFFYLVPANDAYEDTAYNLDLNENEHFRNDAGTYDEAGHLKPFVYKEAETWENAYASKVEAWNCTRANWYSIPTPKYFYPASPALPITGSKQQKAYWHIDHHAVAELFRYRDHCQSCQQTLELLNLRQQDNRVLPKAPLYYANVRTAKKLELEKQSTLEHRAKLEADDQEVLAHHVSDVPETILELFEQQVEELKGKAPCGLIAALAQARLEAKENTLQNDIYLQGLAVLETASQYAT